MDSLQMMIAWLQEEIGLRAAYFLCCVGVLSLFVAALWVVDWIVLRLKWK